MNLDQGLHVEVGPPAASLRSRLFLRSEELKYSLLSKLVPLGDTDGNSTYLDENARVLFQWKKYLPVNGEKHIDRKWPHCFY